jgi:hypothetical protein
MAGSRTLKLSILGDVDSLNKSLKTASGDIDTFGDKVGKAGLAIGKAFAAAAAAAGAAAIAIGIEGVKAAIEDEKAQTQLALALENATGATTAQIKATEESILQMSLATGVADDELRPALGRLVRSTGDITKAQDLLSQALDISAATGKPVEAIANSLAKAYDGNTAALGRLGVGLSAAELKTMSFEEVQGRLTELFGGAAAANAETYAGKIARVQVAFDEAKETVGTALLPILDKLLQFINQNALPAIQAFSAAFSLTEKDGFGKVVNDVGTTLKNTFTPIIQGVKSVFDNVKKAVMDSKEEFEAFWDVVKYIAPLVGSAIGASLKVVGEIAQAVITVIANVLAAIKPLLNTAIDGINLVIRGLNLIKTGRDIPYISPIGGSSGTSQRFLDSGAKGLKAGGAFAQSGSFANEFMGAGLADPTELFNFNGQMVRGVIDATGISDAEASFRQAELLQFKLKNPGRLDPIFTPAGNSQPNITVNVSGAIDAEGTARTIVNTLNNSFYRGTGGAGNLVTP